MLFLTLLEYKSRGGGGGGCPKKNLIPFFVNVNKAKYEYIYEVETQRGG